MYFREFESLRALRRDGTAIGIQGSFPDSKAVFLTPMPNVAVPCAFISAHPAFFVNDTCCSQHQHKATLIANISTRTQPFDVLA
jgi:hypothetical protein